jgi:hypothetical protein
MHEAQIRREKNKESAWGKKEDEGRKGSCIVTILEEVGPKVISPLLPQINN